jgi:DNA-binding transcriptional LysR family regulator
MNQIDIINDEYEVLFMTITRFEIFSTVVELNSFTMAAKKLNMTQSAVSHAVASLESEWGTKLLIRDRRKGLFLTEIGRTTLTQIREILKRMENIKQEVALASDLEMGTVRIGSFNTASSYLLPKIISKFNRKHPNIELMIFDGVQEEIVEWLDTGGIDIGFVIQQDDLKFEISPLIEETMVVIYPEGHPFQDQSMIRVEELEQESFIMPKGIYRFYVEQIFDQAKVDPLIRFEVQNCNTIASMIEDGLGITVGPELFYKTKSNVQIGHLDQSNSHLVSLAFPSLSCASPAVRSFVSEARNIFSRAL